jgi:hypothetical protein
VESDKSYGERASDNLARWLGVGHLTSFDTVLVMSLMPALAVLISSWVLPWDSWLFQRVAGIIAGPYFLYCALVSWHLRLPWGLIAVAATFGAVLSGLAIRERLQPWRRD